MVLPATREVLVSLIERFVPFFENIFPLKPNRSITAFLLSVSAKLDLVVGIPRTGFPFTT